jgi:hypothetical protein
MASGARRVAEMVSAAGQALKLRASPQPSVRIPPSPAADAAFFPTAFTRCHKSISESAHSVLATFWLKLA